MTTQDTQSTEKRTRIERYDASAIEPHWQARWEELGLHRTDLADARNRYYLLTIPVPVGRHPHRPLVHQDADRRDRPIPADARQERLPADRLRRLWPAGRERRDQEQHQPARLDNVEHRQHARRQLRRMGARFDWSAEVVTSDPEYYKWNQWLFLRFLEAGPPTGRSRRSTGARTTGRSPGNRSRGLTGAAGGAARRSRSATSTSGICGSRNTPTSCSISADRVPRAGPDHADELDRTVRGRRDRLRDRAIRPPRGW